MNFESGKITTIAGTGEPGYSGDGGPAERAGIAAGDTVIRFGRFEIEDIYGLMEALSAHSPGDRIEVVVKRDDREETFEVTLEAPGR